MRSTSVACHTQYLSYVEHKRTTKEEKMRRKQIHLLIMWNILVLIANNHCCRRQKHHQHYCRADFSIQYFHFVFPVVPCKCYVICTLSLSPSSSSLTALTSFSALVDVIYSLISFYTPPSLHFTCPYHFDYYYKYCSLHHLPQRSTRANASVCNYGKLRWTTTTTEKNFSHQRRWTVNEMRFTPGTLTHNNTFAILGVPQP